MSEHDKSEVKQQLEDVRNEMEKIAGDIRVKMHLASMDAKDKWKELEPKLHELEVRAEKATETVSAELNDFAHDLRDRLKRLRQDLEAK